MAALTVRTLDWLCFAPAAFHAIFPLSLAAMADGLFETAVAARRSLDALFLATVSERLEVDLNHMPSRLAYARQNLTGDLPLLERASQLLPTVASATLTWCVSCYLLLMRQQPVRVDKCR